MNKKAISLVISGLIVLSNVHSIENVYANEKNANYSEISTTDGNTIIKIPNADLKDAICKELNLSNDTDITVSQLEKLTKLEINGENTSNLQGIEYCKNLKTLSMINCNVKDIRLLSSLTNLETLNLDRNNIKYIYSLSNLKNLKNLTLSSNYINDISPLSNLTNLEKLNLSDNCILDLRPLANIKNKLDKNLEYEYQTIELEPVKMPYDKKVIMEIPKIYDIDGTLIKEPSIFSDAGEHKIVGNTVVWTNVVEGGTLEIVFENKDKTFDVSICQDVIKQNENISLTDIKGHWAYESISNFINKGYISLSFFRDPPSLTNTFN